MKIDILNINDFVDANHVLEVTNPVFFSSDKMPTDDGLFSMEIFGITEKERRNKFGYIDLQGHYIHPLIASGFSRMGSLRKIMNGEKYAVLADRKITIVPESFKGAQTGLSFFWDNFDRINWITELEEETENSVDKKIRLQFLKSLKKEEFFVSKWLVLPPVYRAENSTEGTAGEEINRLYKDLLHKTRSLKTGFSFDIFGEGTKIAIQNLLIRLYLETLKTISGKHPQPDGTLKGSPKNSLIRKNLLGKTLDFSASSVITSPQISSSKSVYDLPVPFGYGRFPLATLLALFQPFYVNAIVDFLDRYVRKFANENYGMIKKIDLNQFSTQEAEKMIKKFIKSPDERFSPISIEYTNLDGVKSKSPIDIFVFKSEADAKNYKNFVKRNFTLGEMLYIISLDVLADKHVYTTRYPVINYQNIYPSKIKVASTKKTEEVWLRFDDGSTGDAYAHYDEYPLVGTSYNSNFIDVMVIGNAYLKSLDGDYDGDVVYMKAVFSHEANAEAEKLIFSKTNILNASGGPARGISKISKEAGLAIYELTKDGN